LEKEFLNTVGGNANLCIYKDPLLDIYPKSLSIAYNRDTCTSMYLAALFTIDQLESV
jgi:hypothetical protein